MIRALVTALPAAALMIAALPFAAQAETPDALNAAYPLNTCPVSGHELGKMGDPVSKDYGGREVQFCCRGCINKFEAAEEENLAKLDEQIAAQQSDAYPLEECPVSGQKLGKMGDPVDYVHQNRLVRLCCAGCAKKVDAAPAKYLQKLDQAAADEQRADYPLETCVVSGEELGAMGEPVEVIVGGKLLRLCCAGCKKKVEAAPAEYLSRLEGGHSSGAMSSGHQNH